MVNQTKDARIKRWGNMSQRESKMNPAMSHKLLFLLSSLRPFCCGPSGLFGLKEQQLGAPLAAEPFRGLECQWWGIVYSTHKSLFSSAGHRAAGVSFLSLVAWPSTGTVRSAQVYMQECPLIFVSLPHVW